MNKIETDEDLIDKEMMYIGQLITDVTNHYINKRESVNREIRHISLIKSLSMILRVYLEKTHAPEEVLQKCFLEPYHKLSEALKTNESITGSRVAILEMLEKQLKEFENEPTDPIKAALDILEKQLQEFENE